MGYQIIYIDLPCCIKGVTHLCRDGFYHIYINSRLGYYEQQKAIRHELEHIARGDFYSPDIPIGIIETM